MGSVDTDEVKPTIDLASASTFKQGHPWEQYAWLRGHTPLLAPRGGGARVLGRDEAQGHRLGEPPATRLQLVRRRCAPQRPGRRDAQRRPQGD